MEYNEQKYFESEVEDALDQLESDRLKKRYAAMIDSNPVVEKPGFLGQYGKIILMLFVFVSVLLVAGFKFFSSNKLEEKTHEIMASLDVYQNPSWSLRSSSSPSVDGLANYQQHLISENYDQAIKATNAIPQENRDYHLQLSLSQAYLKAGEYNKALESSQKIINQGTFGIQEAEFTKVMALIMLDQDAQELMEKIITNKQYKWKKIDQLHKLI